MGFSGGVLQRCDGFVKPGLVLVVGEGTVTEVGQQLVFQSGKTKSPGQAWQLIYTK